MQHPRGAPGTPQATTFTLTRKELDFPVGIGSNIIDVSVSMEWCDEAADIVSPPERVTSTDIAEGRDDPKGIAATLTAVACRLVSIDTCIISAGFYQYTRYRCCSYIQTAVALQVLK